MVGLSTIDIQASSTKAHWGLRRALLTIHCLMLQPRSRQVLYRDLYNFDTDGLEGGCTCTMSLFQGTSNCTCILDLEPPVTTRMTYLCCPTDVGLVGCRACDVGLPLRLNITSTFENASPTFSNNLRVCILPIYIPQSRKILSQIRITPNLDVDSSCHLDFHTTTPPLCPAQLSTLLLRRAGN